MPDTMNIPQPGQQAAQPRSMAAAISGTERTADNPQQGTSEERQAKLQLADVDKENMLKIVRHYTEMWSLPRRVTVRDCLRRFEYTKGNQYISFDPYNFRFFDPMDSSVVGSQQGSDDAAGDIGAHVTNVVQWLLRVFVASLGGTMPATRFSPGDAENDLDNQTADSASKANALVERWNNAKRMLKQRLAYLGLSGNYFRHTRWVRDSRLCGTMKEPIYGNEMTEVWPDHYQCPKCATTTPADGVLKLKGSAQCPKCGTPLDGADFFPAYSMEMPVIKGYEELPKGQVRQTVYSVLQVQIAPWDDESGQDPLTNTPILKLAVEIDQAALRAMFPDEWEAAQGSGETGGAPEGELDRMARLRSYIPGLTRGSALMTTGQLPTYERTWIQPLAYNCLEKKEDADRLKSLYPRGCLVSAVNGKWVYSEEASLTDEWTMCTTGILPGPNPPAVLDPAMDFQDRINDISNSIDEYFDRLASPGILYNQKMISKGIAGRFMPPGTLTPVHVNLADGRTLKDAFYQPEFHIDSGWNPYLQMLMTFCQLLTGITPQMYGGHQQGIDTKGGQEQALDVATGIMRLYWDQVREEDAQAAKLAVRCMGDHATDDQHNVIDGDTGPGTFKNDKIPVENLKGEFNAYPDEEQGYPVSFEETRQMLEEIINASSKNPLVQELFQPMSNRRYFARYLAPGLEIPGQVQRYKVLRDIAKLMEGTPLPARDPQTGQPTEVSSVIPDKDFDDLEVAQEVVREFAEKNYDMAKERPRQFDNLRLYYKLAVRFQKELEIESAPPAPALPAPGPGAAAAVAQ